MRKKFYLLWLALGLLQIAAPGGNAADLLSSGPEEASPRISREFFKKPLKANVEIVGSDGRAKSYPSEVKWEETAGEPEVLPEGALAAFPDSVGCAKLAELGDARLCFKQMGDVSNLGLNEREMWLEGADTHSQGCSSLELASARRSFPSADWIDVRFVAREQIANCVPHSIRVILSA